MRNDISEIINRISDKDMELAKLFEYFANEFLEMEKLTENFSKRFSKKATYSSNRIIINHELLKSQLKYLPEVANAIIDIGAAQQFKIKIHPSLIKEGLFNLYSSEKKEECDSICVCKAFDEWNCDKLGFKGAAKYLFNSYFIKKSTLILTFAWDELDFIKKFKECFDSYASEGKTICIVLVTLDGMSIQYLR